jgi:hypothetical protein
MAQLDEKGGVNMRIASLGLLAVSLSAALSACSGTNPFTSGTPGLAEPGSARPRWWREAPDAARAGVYVAQANGASDGIVFGYGARNRSNDAPRCSIGGQSFEETQIAADASGRLYVPSVAGGTVSIYAPRCGRLLRRLTDPGGDDLDVAIDGSAFYALGGTHVTACTIAGCSGQLTDDSIFQLESAAVDHSGNVWAAYYNQSFVPSLIVWIGGAMPGRVVSGYVNQNTPGGLTFDQHDTLVSIQSRFNHVYVYRCDAASASCVNTKTVSLQAASIFGALNAKNTDYQATDYANDSVDVYAYPSFKYRYSYNAGLLSTYSVEGIAQTQ